MKLFFESNTKKYNSKISFIINHDYDDFTLNSFENDLRDFIDKMEKKYNFTWSDKINLEKVEL